MYIQYYKYSTSKKVEKDADDNDDVATLKAAVQNNKIECSWKVVYTADDDDADSKKERRKRTAGCNGMD